MTHKLTSPTDNPVKHPLPFLLALAASFAPALCSSPLTADHHVYGGGLLPLLPDTSQTPYPLPAAPLAVPDARAAFLSGVVEEAAPQESSAGRGRHWRGPPITWSPSCVSRRRGTPRGQWWHRRPRGRPRPHPGSVVPWPHPHAGPVTAALSRARPVAMRPAGAVWVEERETHLWVPVGEDPKCVTCLGTLLETNLPPKFTVCDPYLGLGIVIGPLLEIVTAIFFLPNKHSIRSNKIYVFIQNLHYIV